MQNKQNAKRYIFDGNAIAAAGQIRHPFHDTIAVQAGSTLPSIGGIASARSDGFRFKDVLSFASAYTNVIGRETQKGVFETISVSVVEKFNLLDVVTCDRIVARVAGKHPGNPGGPPESSIIPEGSRFEGLRIGNVHFDMLEVAPAYFCRADRATFSGLQAALEDEEERRQLQALSLPAPDGTPVALPAAGQAADVLAFSIALGKTDAQDQLGSPLVFQLAQFGTVHLGEFFCYPTSRHLVMLRAELGCPYDGDVSACEAIVDGGPYPP